MKLPLPISKTFDLYAFIALLLLIGIPLAYYGQLPEEIPGHFGTDGTVDRWVAKSAIIFLPAIGLFTYIVLGLVAKMTGGETATNWSSGRPKAGMEVAYSRNMRQLLACLRAVCLVAFAYIAWAAVKTALGEMNGLGNGFLYIFLLGVFLPLGYFTWRSIQLSE